MKKWIAAILCLIIIGCFRPMAKYDDPYTCEKKSEVLMDFNGVNMSVFLQWFAQRTKKKIIYSHMRGNFDQKKVYLISHEPIPEKSVEKICMSLLESNGYTLVKVGKDGSEVYKLVETSKASSKPIAIYSIDELDKMDGGDYYISQLVIIKYLKADNVINSLRQAKLLDPSTGSIVEIRGANALIINDFLPNVRRILKIIEMIDKAPPQIETSYIELQFARADEIKRKLTELYKDRSRELSQYHSTGITPAIISDQRTNSLTLRGMNSDIEEMQKLIKRYDKKVRASEMETRVYQLVNVMPDKILPTLKQIIASPNFRNKSVISSHDQDRQEISIIENEHTRTLLVTAPVAIHQLVEKLLKQLDVRRPQVLLEAVICEFTPSDVLNIGVELLKVDKVSNADGHTFAHGLTSFGLSSVVDEFGAIATPERPTLPAGRKLGPGSGLTTFMTHKNKNNIPFLIRALQSVTKTDIISVPRILTDDGEKAEIHVQQEEPVTSVNALNTSTTTTSFKEFVSAGTSLVITPQIIHGNSLRLSIEQDIESFNGNPPAAGIPPPKSSRSLRTIVTVPNEQIIILGGLVGRREVETIDKIPILGDIPLLGLLFQSRSRSVTKTNLYIFIKPKILRDPNFKDLKKASQESKDQVEKLQGVSLDNPYEEHQDDSK